MSGVNESATSSELIEAFDEIIETVSADDFNHLECSHENCKKQGTTTICEDCGLELQEDISHEQDWRQFKDGTGADLTRCQFRKSPVKGIEQDLERLGLPPDVCKLGNQLYMLVTKGDIKKSELRRGISFVCAYEAYKILKKHKTPETLQDKFGLGRKSISQAFTFYKVNIPRSYLQEEDINARHYIPDIMKKLQIKDDHIDRVIRLHDGIKDICPVINRSNPQSISKALVYYYLRRVGCTIPLNKYAKIVGLSDVILSKLAEEISRSLDTTSTVKLD